MRPVEITKSELASKILNLSPLEISQELNCHPETVRRLLRTYGIKYTKNKLNHKFFQAWSSDMAYILGFLTADGCVSSNRPYIFVEVQRTDEDILRYILDQIQCTNKIYQYKHLDKRSGKVYLSSKIGFHSRQIVSDLNKYSIFPNKTGKHKIDFDIPEQFKWDYIRGFFDGDGSAYHAHDVVNIAFSCQSLEYLYDLQRLINKNGSIEVNGKPPKLKYFGGSARYFYDNMYSKYKFCLERKRQKFINGRML